MKAKQLFKNVQIIWSLLFVFTNKFVLLLELLVF